MFLVDKLGITSTLAWHSGKVKRVVTSTLAAETVALAYGMSEALYIREYIQFCAGVRMPILAVVDNKSLVQNLASTHLVEEKRLRMEIGGLKEVIEDELVTVKWVPGGLRLANGLTKVGASVREMLEVVQGGYLNV